MAAWVGAARPERGDGRSPLRWQPGSGEVGSLRIFLAAVHRDLPPGAIAFRGRHRGPAEGLSEYLWAAYLLPERDLVPLGMRGVEAPRYLAVFRGTAAPNDRWTLRRRLPGGAVFGRTAR